VIAKIRQFAPVDSDPSPRQTERRGSVIAFPSFECYGDQILEWLAAIGEREPAPRTVARLARSMRCTAAEIERVRNSLRHSNLASFMRHAANALEAAEWEGARYLLITSMAVMTARAVTARELREVGELRQFPAAMGMVTG